MALGHSRRRWFGTCSCKPVPRGLPSSDKQLRATWPHGLSRSWRTIVGKPHLTPRVRVAFWWEAPGYAKRNPEGARAKRLAALAEPQHRMRHIRLLQRSDLLSSQLHLQRRHSIRKMVRFRRAHDRRRNRRLAQQIALLNWSVSDRFVASAAHGRVSFPRASGLHGITPIPSAAHSDIISRSSSR